MLENSEEFWEEAWRRHIENYLRAVPRAGIFLKNYFADIRSVLEVAGGSCRDGRYLARKGYETVCSDFDEKTISYLQKVRFPDDVLRYSREDAFDLSFENDSFDLVFHNGFFILFDENESLYAMLKEQARVARRYVVILVHNAQNRTLVHNFAQKARTDDLYNIRFFRKDEIAEIVAKSGISYKNVRFLKFGGIFDTFYKKRLKKVLPNPLYPVSERLIPKLYQAQKWENTERICCVVELEQ